MIDAIALALGYAVLLVMALVVAYLIGEVVWAFIVAVDLLAFFISRGRKPDYRYTGADTHQWVWFFLKHWWNCFGYRKGCFTTRMETGGYWAGFRDWR